jgi:hypothetical protein
MAESQTRPELTDVDSPEINTFDQRKNLELLRQAFVPGESLIVVARASGVRRLRSGVLALTDRRVLYVMERVMRLPLVISIPRGEVVDVEIEEQPLTGMLRVTTPDRTIRFEHVRPKMRTWPFFWQLRKELDARAQVPVGE